jgi:hypothetical protein
VKNSSKRDSAQLRWYTAWSPNPIMSSAQKRFESGNHLEQFLVDPHWRNRWNFPFRSRSNSSNWSARCIAAMRLAFSLERDSAQARKND